MDSETWGDAGVHAVVARVRSLFATSGARSLAVVMLLPIVSGIYPSIVLAGGLTSVISAIELGVLVFSGGASVAIVLADFEGPRSRGLCIVAAVGVVLIPGAVFTAALSPTVRTLLRVELFVTLTALVVGAIGVSIGFGDDPWWLPSPVTLGFGLCLVATLDALSTLLTGSVTVDFIVNGRTMWLSGLASSVGVGVVAFVVTVRPYLLRRLDIERFRVGCAIALCLVGANIAGLVGGSPATVAIACSVVLAHRRSTGDEERGVQVEDNRRQRSNSQEDRR
ncbi:DUF5794 domain-containing protein [Natronomonas gomsonensis]|uniref:DUF5794 domain-containing protein n=1 Tax=Natronomonas gomsonensis TaxID=1046043 RepID=UPI0015B7BFC2|nr:DUF5794 domain-containing protein [Natronomonas gomsonensis]